MWLLLVMTTLWVVTLEQTVDPPAPSEVATVAPPADTTTGGPDNNTYGQRLYGADYHPMEGGTELRAPLSVAVPIRQRGVLSSGDPEYPCFGTFRSRRVLLTSAYCAVEGHIDKEYTNWRYQDLEIQWLEGPLRRKRQAVIALTHPFTVVSYTFHYAKWLNETAFSKPGELITDVTEYRKIIENPSSVGIVLGSRPYKAGAVSLDQSNCSDFVYQVRRIPEFPENLTEGVFCVYMGVSSVKLNGEDIEPGMPCRDSLGSPVLVEGPSGFNRVLGIVIMYMCNWLPPEWGDIPKIAVATSTAYAFNYTVLDLPSPRPRFTFRHWPARKTPYTTRRLPIQLARSESVSPTFRTELCFIILLALGLRGDL